MIKTKLALTVAIILATSVISFGQTKKQVQFFSYHLSQYNRPVMVSTGKYQAYFKNMGESREQGRIIIDETAKGLTIKWLDGNDWIAKFTKKEKKAEHDELFGDVIRTTYFGKWIEEKTDCMFIITETNSSGCIATLKSQKVVDVDYNINTWKKTFVFGIRGECF
ncbi:hypothetical protein ABDJ41_12075 [Pedobacter sp. ASV1-7]|uniref:hypothetical protein n=1 Tax=Pedobacter sp. ASV1-7 TaxID=3145237 RepID=UPI0032E91DCF